VSATQHTPGPWSFVEKKNQKMISDWDLKIGNYSISIFPYKRVYSEDKTHSGLVLDEVKMADAHLFVASREVFEALKLVVKHHVKGINPFSDAAILSAIAAIGKATA
jgi:hypothetical protein